MSRWELFKSFCNDLDKEKCNDEVQLCIQGKSIRLLPRNLLLDHLNRNKHRTTSYVKI